MKNIPDAKVETSMMDLRSIYFCLIDCDCTPDAQTFAFTQRALATRKFSSGSDTVPTNLFVLTNLFVHDTRRPANKTIVFVHQIQHSCTTTNLFVHQIHALTNS